jgi:hypothetical protein
MKDDPIERDDESPRHEASEKTQTRPVPPQGQAQYREGDNEVVEEPFVYEGRTDRDAWGGKPVDRDGEVFSGRDLRGEEKKRD